MERENNKREREGEEEEEMKNKDPSENSLKRQHLGTHKHHKLEIVGNISRDDEGEDKKKDDYITLGVFDFPWRKESMISKSGEEWCFEDSFFFSLNNNNNNTCITSHVENEFPDQCLSESAETCIKSIDFPSDKFEETEWSSEKEGVDCTWTSILSHPFS